MNFADDEILLYDLSRRPASFDFVTCLSTAIACGIKHIRFVVDRGWKPKDYEDAQRRYDSIVKPVVALFGLTYSEGEPRGLEISHFFHKCVEAYTQFGKIGKIQVKPKNHPRDYVTITLRNSRTRVRNSKESEWMKFAEKCDRQCIIIREYTERPIDIEDRMELYANAYTNMMVINGPITLCVHSDAPYICMRTIGPDSNSFSTSPEFMKKIGITPGFQFPWAHANQRLSYLDDTADNLMYEYLLMSKLRDAA